MHYTVFTYNFLGIERFRWSGKEALAPGKHTIVFNFTYDGPGLAKGGTGVLTVDGQEAESKKIAHTIPSIMTIDEGFDVGVDTRLSVDDTDYQPPFRFTGKSLKVTIKLGPPQIVAADKKSAAQAVASANN